MSESLVDSRVARGKYSRNASSTSPKYAPCLRYNLIQGDRLALSGSLPTLIALSERGYPRKSQGLVT